MKLSIPFGIDLGTTHSAAAVYLPGASHPLSFSDEHNRHVMPSAIGLSPAGDLVAGWPAIEGQFGPVTPLTSFKRRMGQRALLRLHDREFTPTEASGHLLSALTGRFSEQLRDREEGAELRLNRALITIPAYFDLPQVEATREAGELAGLEVIGLLQEPTAAAMYYSWKHQLNDGNFLVYDLGGGTFDVSVIRCIAGEYQVLGIDGDNHLGGDDFDRRLADLLRARLNQAGYALGTTLESEDDHLRFELLARHARVLKERLTDQAVAHLQVSEIFSDRQGQRVDLDLEVSRNDFTTSISDLLQGTLAACQRALHQSQEQAAVGLADIDYVLMVGGSTYVPAVQEAIAAALCGPGISRATAPLSDEPEMCVALGAALHAATLGRVRIEGERADIALELEDLPAAPGDPLSGQMELSPEKDAHALELHAPGGEVLARAPLRRHAPGQWNFFLPGYPGGLSERPRAVAVDASGTPVASLTMWLPMRAAESLPAPAPTLSNPAVLSKAIFLEVVENGHPSRHMLVPRGAHLPTRATHRLLTADRSAAVVLRLFQERLPIHTLVLPLPEHTPVGTPLTLDLDVDEALRMSARGTIGPQDFWVRIDPPQAPAHLDWPTIEALLMRADQVGARLWGFEAERFADRVIPLVAGIEAAVHQDPVRLQALAHRLRGLLDDFAPRPTRVPGLTRVEATLNAIRRAVFRRGGTLQGLNQDDWRARLETLQAEVRRVWHEDDDRAWGQLADRIQAIYETVAQDDSRFLRTNPEAYARRVHEVLKLRAARLRQEIREFTRSPDPDERALQEPELLDIDAALAADIQAPLQSIGETANGAPMARHQEELEQLSLRLEQLDDRLQRVRTLGLLKRAEDA
ncbi:hypothetical protein DL240_12705 [Lujinxingia litoralis]|uniref:Molecular chaperone DnaK n=1 Tax=Lujinxingia litoralis TaxID=2211119 RepID=A0A328C7U5_9DELT|nr:Hsp70 family protein [Lujinxingia litoralis]RAL21708.1 hypothetical protein DL240_12705 [Lujinxingia litoralis]